MERVARGMKGMCGDNVKPRTRIVQSKAPYYNRKGIILRHNFNTRAMPGYKSFPVYPGHSRSQSLRTQKYALLIRWTSVTLFPLFN